MLALAVLLDAFTGEPPAAVHPVVWMGKVLGWLEARAPHTELARFGFGLVAANALPLGWGGLAALLERRTPWPVHAALLNAAFAGNALLGAAARVEASMATGRVDDARCELRWLVSRPTLQLDATQVCSAAVESLAENFVDSWVAPLCAYSLFGLGGAYAYRAANTADAMWGYHTPAYQWLGKAIARLDDVLNWGPARLGALLLCVTGPRPHVAVNVWRQNAGLTASPNAGHPMSVIAGQLDLQLEKPGHYVLHRHGRAPSITDIAAARQLVTRAMLLAALLSLVLRKLTHP